MLPLHGLESSARFSACGRYRYELTRRWQPGPAATFVMLNPSTADAEHNDPTITRCIGFARSWGCSGVRVVNAYGYRATDPRHLWQVDDPVGPDNDAALARAAADSLADQGPLVAAWGAHARPNRIAELRALPGFDRLTALGVTKAGHPRHPLYMPASSQLAAWPARAAA